MPCFSSARIQLTSIPPKKSALHSKKGKPRRRMPGFPLHIAVKTHPRQLPGSDSSGPSIADRCLAFLDNHRHFSVPSRVLQHLLEPLGTCEYVIIHSLIPVGRPGLFSERSGAFSEDQYFSFHAHLRCQFPDERYLRGFSLIECVIIPSSNPILMSICADAVFVMLPPWSLPSESVIG